MILLCNHYLGIFQLFYFYLVILQLLVFLSYVRPFFPIIYEKILFCQTFLVCGNGCLKSHIKGITHQRVANRDLINPRYHIGEILGVNYDRSFAGDGDCTNIGKFTLAVAGNIADGLGGGRSRLGAGVGQVADLLAESAAVIERIIVNGRRGEGLVLSSAGIIHIECAGLRDIQKLDAEVGAGGAGGKLMDGEEINRTEIQRLTGIHGIAYIFHGTGTDEDRKLTAEGSILSQKIWKLGNLYVTV